MALSITQSNAGDTGTSAPSSTLVSLSGSSTAGNTLVMAVSSDAYISVAPTGWTLNSNCSNMTYLGHYVYTKIAAGGESSWTLTPDSAAAVAWVVFEVTGTDGAPFDIAAAQFLQSAGNAYTTASLTPTAGERLLVAVFGGSFNGTALQGVSGWTNSFTEVGDAWSKKTSGTNDSISVASRVVVADGSTSYSTDVTWDNTVSPQARASIILSLKGLVGANLAPTANAGADRTVQASTLITLNGSGSTDGETTVATYNWQQITGTPVTLNNSNTVMPSFTSPAEDTLLVFGLTVTDDQGATSSQDTVSITVSRAQISTTAQVRVSGAWIEKPVYVRKGGVWVT